MKLLVRHILLAVAVGTVVVVLSPFVRSIRGKSAHAELVVRSLGKSTMGDADSAATQASDIKHAWDVFAALVNATDKDKLCPEWRKWSDKCAVGLNNPNNNCADDAKPIKSSCNALEADFSSLRLPFQVGFTLGANRDKETGTHGPQLASVLFNRAAADYIRTEGLGNTQNLNKILNSLSSQAAWQERRLAPPPPDGPFGHPMAVKLIWEVVNDVGSNEANVYDSDSKMQDQYLSPDPIAQMQPITHWPGYKLDANIQPCNPSEPPTGGKVHPLISLSCFYGYHINLDDPSTKSMLGADTPTVLPGPLLGKGKARVILVGFHAIELTKEHPSWVWMTFFWTRETNGHADWAVPWQHFQVRTTTTDGADDSAVHIGGPVFNPYLEGQIDQYGTTSNCLSCHSLATYTPGEAAGNLGRAQVYALSANPDSASFPMAESNAANAGYFNGSLRTSFLWSIATNQFRPTTPASPPPAKKPK